MPEFRTGGLETVYHSPDDTAGSYTAIAGEITRADALPIEAITQETTSGDYQSGDTSAPTIYFNDHDDYSTLRNLAVGANRARTYFILEFKDGTLLKVSEAVYPKCWLEPKPVRADGDSEWALSWNESADTMLESITSLP